MGTPQFGLCIHNRAATFMPEHGLDYDLHRLIDLAVLSEELGFYAVSVGDGLLGKPRWRPIPTLASIAARTSQIKVMTNILMPHLYGNPVHLGQDLSTLDEISRGRLIVGTGIGWGRTDLIEYEHRLCGIPWDRRADAFAEAVYLLRRLWTEERVTHAGEFWQLQDVRLGIKPYLGGRPPIWVSGGRHDTSEVADASYSHPIQHESDSEPLAPAALDRVAQLADGWQPDHCTPDEYRSGLKAVRRLAAQKYGRASEELTAALSLGVFVTTNIAAGYQEVKWYEDNYHNASIPEKSLQKSNVVGSPRQCLRQIERFVDAGVQTFIICVRARDMFGMVRKLADLLLR